MGRPSKGRATLLTNIEVPQAGKYVMPANTLTTRTMVKNTINSKSSFSTISTHKQKGKFESETSKHELYPQY